LDERGRAIIEVFGELPRIVDTETSARLIMPWMYTDRFYSRPGAIDQLTAWFLQAPFPPSPEAMYQQSRVTMACDTSAHLGNIRCTTLVLVGNDDLLMPCKFSEELAKGIPGAKLVVLQGTGHGLLIESPDAVSAAMLDFLSKQV